MWKTLTECQEPTRPQPKKKKPGKKKRKIKTFKDNSIGVLVSNKGVVTSQIITRVVSVRSQDNVTRNCKRKLRRNLKDKYNR